MQVDDLVQDQSTHHSTECISSRRSGCHVWFARVPCPWVDILDVFMLTAAGAVTREETLMNTCVELCVTASDVPQ